MANQGRNTVKNAIDAVASRKFLSFEDIDTIEWISREHSGQFFEDGDAAKNILVLLANFLNEPLATEARPSGEDHDSSWEALGSTSYKQSALRSLARLARGELGPATVGAAVRGLGEGFEVELSSEEGAGFGGALLSNGLALLLVLRTAGEETRMKAKDLLALADYDTKRTLAILAAALRLPDLCEVDLLGLARMFHGLTTPAPWVISDGEDIDCNCFVKTIDDLIHASLETQVIGIFSTALSDFLPKTDNHLAGPSDKLIGAIGWTLQAIDNLLTFSKPSGALLDSLSMNSELFSSLIFPYTQRAVALLAAGDHPGEWSAPAGRALKLGLYLAANVACRQWSPAPGGSGEHTPSPKGMLPSRRRRRAEAQAAAYPTVVACLDLVARRRRGGEPASMGGGGGSGSGGGGSGGGEAWGGPPAGLVGAVLVLLVNLELLELDLQGGWAEEQKAVFAGVYELRQALGPRGRARALASLERPCRPGGGGGGGGVPVLRASGTYRAVWAVFAGCQDSGYGTQMMQWGAAYVKGILEAFGLDSKLRRADSTRTVLLKTLAQAKVEDDEECKGSGGNAESKNGNVIAGQQKEGGQSKMMGDKQIIIEAKLSEAKDHQQLKNASHNGSKEEDDPKAEEKFRLLGNLPTFEDERNKRQQGGKVQFCIPSTGKRRLALLSEQKEYSIGAKGEQQHSVDIPSHFLCSITQDVMREPVKSPDGLVFEKHTIERWIDQNGSICPITHKELLMGDLVRDEELENEMLHWKIQKSLLQNTNDWLTSSATDEEDFEEDDIYEF